MTTRNYEVGNRITYEDFGGDRRTGIVTGKYDDIKNGRPGFDMTLTNGLEVWGYDEQIVY